MSSKKDKKDKKKKKEEQEESEAVEASEEVAETSTKASDVSKSSEKYAEKVRLVSVIAKPLASRKTTKRLYKLVKKGSQHLYIHIGAYRRGGNMFV